LPAPAFIKVANLKALSKKYILTSLLKTRTLEGTTPYLLRNDFNQIFTIEIDEKLYKDVVKKFQSFEHIELLNGGSSEILFILLPRLKVPTLFWLFGHYSMDETGQGSDLTPILKSWKLFWEDLIKLSSL